jgi:hypothetical protein
MNGKAIESKSIAKKEGTWRNEKIIILPCVEELLLVTGSTFLNPILPVFIQSLVLEAGRLKSAMGGMIAAFGIARACIWIYLRERWQSVLGVSFCW